MRTNYLHKTGGDSLQVEKYREHLEPKGFSFRLVPSTRRAELRPGAVAHIVNVDRPYEFLAATQAADRHGATILLSPIHHRQHRISAMDRNRPGFLGRAGRLVRDPAQLEWLKQAARMRGSDIRWLLQQPNSESALAAAVRSAIQRADALVVLAAGELDALRTDYGVSAEMPAVTIPNGVDVDPSRSIEGRRDVDVLLVGRVEERKNQVAVLKALKGVGGLNIHIAGGLTARSPDFRAEFRAIVDHSSNVTWHGHVPPSELPGLYVRSKLVINASYVEVLSLVEMEALAYGCNLIGCADGNTSEYFGSYGAFVSADAVASELPRLVRDALSAGPNLTAAALIRQDYTWARVAEMLEKEYLKVLR